MSIFMSLLRKRKNKYTELEYIESTGTQYIDTGITPKANINFDVDYAITTLATWETIIGSDNDSTGKLFFGAVASSNITRSYWYYAGATTTFDNGIGQLNLKTNITSQDGTITMSNTNGTISKTLTGTITTSLLNMYLFALNRNNSLSDLSKAKIYSAKIYDNGILVRDFIPVIDENNIVCMYDRVTKNYFYNQGTGTFTPGYLPKYYTITADSSIVTVPQSSLVGETITLVSVDTTKVVSSFKLNNVLTNGNSFVMPSNNVVITDITLIEPQYTELEYIESTGTQYIDTGIKGKPTTEVILEATKVSSTYGKNFFGSESSNARFTLYLYNATRIYGYLGVGNFPFTTVSSDSYLNKHKYSLKAYNNSPQIYIDDVRVSMTQQGSSTIGTFTETDKSIYLFASHSSDDTAGGLCDMKLYSFQIKENDILVRDMIPVLDNNNVACLYDKVNNIFYYNQGTGDFVYGTLQN